MPLHGASQRKNSLFGCSSQDEIGWQEARTSSAKQVPKHTAHLLLLWFPQDCNQSQLWAKEMLFWGKEQPVFNQLWTQRGKLNTHMMQFLQLPSSQAGLLLSLPRCRARSGCTHSVAALQSIQACQRREGSHSLLEHSERVCWSLLWPRDAADSAKIPLLLKQQPSSHKGALCRGQLLWRGGGTWPPAPPRSGGRREVVHKLSLPL